MSFINKRDGLEKFDTLPLLCNHCGFQTKLREPSAEVLDALFEVSTLYEWEQELAMLLRTKELFDRFPDTRHPKKINKIFLDKEDRPKMEADPEFEAALEADPELKTFLSRHMFLFPGRLETAAKAVEELRHTDVHLIGCGECGRGHFIVEPSFYETVY